MLMALNAVQGWQRLALATIFSRPYGTRGRPGAGCLINLISAGLSELSPTSKKAQDLVALSKASKQCAPESSRISGGIEFEIRYSHTLNIPFINGNVRVEAGTGTLLLRARRSRLDDRQIDADGGMV